MKKVEEEEKERVKESDSIMNQHVYIETIQSERASRSQAYRQTTTGMANKSNVSCSYQRITSTKEIPSVQYLPRIVL